MVCKLKSVVVCINFMYHDASMANCDNGYRSRDSTSNLITLNHKPKKLKFVLPCLVVQNTHTVRATSNDVLRRR